MPSFQPDNDPRFAVFRGWVGVMQARAVASSKKREQFSDATARIYESLWRGWVEWLASRDLQWSKARPEDVAAFLSGPAPSPADRRTRKPIEHHQMANFTQQRYWRVLHAVYAYAVVNGLLERSPFVTARGARPVVTERSLERRLLPPGVLEMLRDPRRLAALLPIGDPSQWWLLRDRAAVALVAHCGLATRELMALTGKDLRVGAQMLDPVGRTPDLPHVARGPAPAVVDVPGEGDRPPRSIPLPSAALRVLEPWLLRRADLLQARRREARGRDVPSDADAPVLLSREAPGPLPVPAVDAPTIYYSFRRCLDAAIAAIGKGSKGQYVARGAAALRNTVIADWARTLGNERAAELAGVKPQSLRATPRHNFSAEGGGPIPRKHAP
ncbi:MAG TPA: hypothetical protein VLK85_35360 [Ramlibacter sp.]|nr:hypothetical protein [Ramlibacter sp.]